MNSPLVQLSLLRLRSFFREPSILFWTFGFPILLSIALGIAFRNRPPDPVNVAVEASPMAQSIVDALAKNPDVKVKLLDEVGAREALRGAKVDLVVVAGPPRTYRYDPTRPESRLARLIVDDVLQRADGRADPQATTDSKVTEPGSRYIDFLVPGLIGMNLMSSGMWGVGYVLVEMRTRKLMKRLMATPMKKSHFLLSMLIVRGLVLCVVELPALLLFAALVFSVPVRGSIVLLWLVALLGALSFAGMGLLVASRAKNTETVSGLMNLFMLPMFVCSGVFFSSSHFPESIQPVIHFLPLTALNDALRTIMIDGSGLLVVGKEVSVLAVWGLVSFAVALRIFRWR